jgi:uncharacterized protein YecT (DUF1311 family)
MSRDVRYVFGHRTQLAAVVVLALAMVSWPGKSVAMDCSRAKTASEKEICGEPAMLGLDKTLNEAYAKLRGKVSRAERQRLALFQRIWVAKRDRCGAKGDCLKEAMERRIAALVAGGNEAAPPEEQHGPFVIRYLKSPAWSLWDSAVPIIVKGPPGDGVKAIKQRLQDNVDQASSGCEDLDGDVADFDYSYGSHLEYADKRFFTLKNNWDMYCGGAYPEHGFEYVTYLVSSGEVLDFSSAFKKDLTAETIVQLAKKHLKELPEELKNPAPDCEDQELPDSYRVAVVRDGLLFKQVLGHARLACEIVVTLPHRILQPFIAPEGPLGASTKHR